MPFGLLGDEDELAQMGLLAGAPNPALQKQAQMQGLLATGLGILAANDGRRPGMSAIGQGGLQGLQHYQGSLNAAHSNQRQNVMTQLQLAKLKQQQQQAIAQQQARQQLQQALSGQPVPNATAVDDEGNPNPQSVMPPSREAITSALAQIDPEAAAKAALAQQQGAGTAVVNAGDKQIVIDKATGQPIREIPMGVAPQAMLPYQLPTASAMLSEEGAQKRHADTLAEQWRRHVTPGGAAQLSAETQRALHATPSGSAKLSAGVTTRGQDISAATARAGQAVTKRGQDFGADIEKRKMLLKEGKPVGNITWD